MSGTCPWWCSWSSLAWINHRGDHFYCLLRTWFVYMPMLKTGAFLFVLVVHLLTVVLWGLMCMYGSLCITSNFISNFSVTHCSTKCCLEDFHFYLILHPRSIYGERLQLVVTWYFKFYFCISVFLYFHIVMYKNGRFLNIVSSSIQ